MGYDIEKIRADFPILQRKVYGKDLIYLDNAASAQTPKQVVETIERGYYQQKANVHRGVHTMSQEATLAHEEARKQIARFLNAKSDSEIIFTRGATEAINLVAYSFGEAFLKEGDEIILSVMEHHANIVPWQLLQTRKGIIIRVAEINEKGELMLGHLESLINERTKLISVTHASNVLGTITPAKEIVHIAHKHNIPVLLDGAQSVCHEQVDVQDLDVDFFVFSSHKLYGPTGIGALYGKEKWLDKMPPYQGGGEMIGRVSFSGTTFNELPFKFEAGTPDYIGSTALSAAIGYVQSIGLENIAQWEQTLLKQATEGLLTVDGIKIYGTSHEKSALISFLVKDIHPYDMGMMLDKLGIAVRTGHHCAQPLMDRLGIEGTVRASFGLYNTPQEVEAFVKAVQRIANLF